ncbi:MAG: alanine racemase [Pseudomonadales bacterium]|nr:alanine racemase [Pseudomonadales bacterium]
MSIRGRVQASIDLQAVQANFRKAKSLSGNSRMVAVVKANAYGHGLVPVATALDEADLFAVTDLNEALQLKAAAIEKPVLILQGFIDRDEIPLIAASGFQLVLHSLEQLAVLDEALDASTLVQPLTCWLKMDTGMGRLGIPARDYATTWRHLRSKPYINDVIMMTHLANTSLPGSALTTAQLKDFNAVQHELAAEGPATSIASSAGILSDLGIQADWARPGIMLYGSSPFPWNISNLRASSLHLAAVMTLQAKIIAIKDMNKGDNVGYCSQFICPRPMRVGIVAIGYADGYPSNTPNGTPVLVRGKRCETIGRVSMDMLAVDLSEHPEACTGDVATLWGKDLAIDEIAAKTGILSYNLTCSITRRVNFVYERSE